MIISGSHEFLVGAASIAPEVRVVLFALIGLLLVTLGFLGAVALGLRRRSPEPLSSSEPDDGLSPVLYDDPELAELLLVKTVHATEGASLGAGGVGGGTVACRTCRREYEENVQFCPRDARRLVPTAEMDAKTKGGTVCPTCRRTFDAGLRFCPHDAAELLPVSLYEATRGDVSGPATTGVMGKICPQCQKRYDSAATFCGQDGADLAVIN